MNVIALVPAYNEEERVAATVKAIRSTGAVARVLVVDDGSTDGTATVARTAGAEVLSLPVNRGKGDALQAGIEALGPDADVLLFLDADLGDSAAEATALLRPVLAGEAAMAIATLPKPPRSGGFGLVKTLARRGIRSLTGLEMAAPLSGQRALSREAWMAALPLASGFGIEVALTVRVAWAGLPVLEVPTVMRHAATGKDLPGFVHRGRQFAAIAATLARLRASLPVRS